MHCLVVIPLRLGSQRLAKKILKDLIPGRSLAVQSIERVYQSLNEFDNITYVTAIDDELTRKHLEENLSAEVKNDLHIVMTEKNCPSGTDRVYAAYDFLKNKIEAVKNCDDLAIINVQGDMPFVGSRGLQEVVKFYQSQDASYFQKAQVVTMGQKFPDPEHFERPQSVKVLCDINKKALYFSRFPIPFSRRSREELEVVSPMTLWHIGVYGYTRKALIEFCSENPCEYERAEGLEQLRGLYLGFPYHVLETRALKGDSFRGIDTEEDFEWARKRYLEIYGDPKNENN